MSITFFTTNDDIEAINIANSNTYALIGALNTAEPTLNIDTVELLGHIKHKNLPIFINALKRIGDDEKFCACGLSLYQLADYAESLLAIAEHAIKTNQNVHYC